MLLCVICPCHNNLCGGIAVDSIVHLVLHRGKEILGNMTIKGVVHSGSIYPY